MSRPYDILVWGATGFTGRYVAEYLARHAPATLKWALGGRNRAGLEAIQGSLLSINPAVKDVGILVGDGNSKEDLLAILAKTRVVICMTGPYHRYATLVVEACVETGTDYCDITGEVPWVREILDKYGKKAEEKGVLIVPFCGFDSIPSDLGVLVAHRFAADYVKRPLGDTTLVIRKAKGGPSGGTIETMFSLMDDKRFKDPYLLNSSIPTAVKKYNPDFALPFYFSPTRSWVIPSVMGPINTRVVSWSNERLGWAYGSRFSYRECSSIPPTTPFVVAGFLAGLLTAAFTIFRVLIIPIAPLNKLVRGLLPKPGTGPSRESCENGMFDVEIFSVTDKSMMPPAARPIAVSVNVRLSKDPGYMGTALMVSESGLFLALERSKAGRKGGICSTAEALGMPLVERLRKAGMAFDAKRLDL